MSTKLKLMGVDVASFGNCFADEKTAKAITYEDPFKGSYKKLLFNLDGTPAARRHPGRRRLGVRPAVDAGQERRAAGDAAERAAARQGGGDAAPAACVTTIPNDAQVCSCNNVSKGQICDAIRDKNLTLGRGGQGLHQGRHRLRRLPAAGDRPVQGPDQGGRQEGQQRPVRALRLHAPGAVRDRQDQAASRRSTS